VLFLASGVGLIFYFRYEKARMERKRIAEATKGVGKPKVGGPFELIDQNRKPFSSEDLKGKYSLVSVIQLRPGSICMFECVVFLRLGRHAWRLTRASLGVLRFLPLPRYLP
jgi:hypothetical protein